MNERRQEGVTRARYSDGNGGHSDVYTMTIKRVKALVGLLIALFTLAGMVFAAVRFGVGIEVHQVIDQEVKPPDGAIYEQIEKTSTEVIEEIQGVIQDDLDVLEGKVAEEHDRIIRIEERQIAIQHKMEEDKAELIREIRRAGGG
jgi:hypothetical protein